MKRPRQDIPLRPPVPSEHEEQCTVVAYCRAKGLLAFGIPNAARRSYALAARLKREGLEPGVPDIFVCEPAGNDCGLFIEMKRQKGGRVSEEQIKWLRDLRSRNYRCIVARGADEAIRAIDEYLNGRWL